MANQQSEIENQKPKPWQILARRTIYDSDWVGLQHIDVQLPDGEILRGMHLVTFRHQAAAVVPIADDGRILLVDHYRVQTDTRDWEIPAGRIEKDESPEQCVVRELLEETGHCAASFEYLGRYHPSNGSSNQVFHVFIARGVTRVSRIQDTNEVMGLRWFTPQEVREMVARNEIFDGLSLTGLTWAITRGAF